VCCAVTQAKAQDALDRTATLEQEMPVAIAAAENKANQALALVSDLSATVDGLQMQPASQPRKRQRFGMFWDTTTQTAAAINTAYAVTYNSSSISSADPDFANVSLLLHCDGANGSTTFLDSSVPSKVVTAFGNTQISTAQSKFGGASGLFDGAGDYIQTPDADNLDFPGDFTVEMWVRPSNTGPNVQGLIHKRVLNTSGTGTWQLSLTATNVFAFVNLQTITVTSGGAVPANTWSHVACSRSGATIRLFVDGVQTASVADTTNFTNTHPLYLGFDRAAGGTAPANFTDFFTGYIDDVRITKGVARYTANFTPPTAPFPDGAYSQTLNQGVVLRSPSEVQIDTEGVYNFQFSVQIDKTSGGSANFWTWWRVNGVNVPASASQIQIQGNNHEIFGAANILLDLKAGDYVQLMWAVSDTTVQLQHFPASGPVPEIPSVILTVTGNIRSET
jgi:hypothetical protein